MTVIILTMSISPHFSFFTKSIFVYVFFCLVLVQSTMTRASIKENSIKESTKNKPSNLQLLAKQRLLFTQAEESLKNKQYKKYTQQLARLKKLGDYPLIPYLHYQKIRQQLSKASNKSIRQYIKKNQDTPYANKLSRYWLRYLAQKERWRAYLQFYPQKEIDAVFHSQDPIKTISKLSKNSTKRACYYVKALIESNREDEGLALIKTLWLADHSQPDSCDSIFDLWEKKKFLTHELRWQRIKILMKKRKFSLAKYIAKPFNSDDKKIISLWISLYKKPQKIVNSSVFDSTHQYKDIIIKQALKRLARKDPEKLITLLENPKFIKKLSSAEQLYATKKLGMSLAKKHHQQAWQWLDKIKDKDSTKKIREWRIRSSIRQQNWQQIKASIARLSDKEKTSDRWIYWLAKSNLELNKSTKAKKLFTSLANKRSYYGFLSADYLNQSYQFDNKAIVIDAKKMNQLKKHPAIRRAYEFFSLQRKLEARREWYFLTQNLLTLPERIIASKIAQTWGWHDRAILTIAYTPERDDLKLRFPISNSQLVEKYAKKNKLDKSYIYAFIRRESAFSHDARSPVGAIGLMQVMPRTGKAVAQKIKVRFKNKKQLYQPEFNIQIGTSYLKSMLKKYDQQIILASSAYNAGPNRVKRWLPKKHPMDAASWIETIPFKETRGYVSAILMYRAIYQYRLSQPVTPLNEQMVLFESKQSERLAMLTSKKLANKKLKKQKLTNKKLTKRKLVIKNILASRP